MSKKLTDLCTDYAAAWTARDAFALANHFEPDAALVVNGTPHADPKSIADFAETFFALLPDLHFMADDTRTAGNNALQSWTLYGHHSKTNSFTKLSGWNTFTVSKNGKIQSAQMFYDPAELKTK